MMMESIGTAYFLAVEKCRRRLRNPCLQKTLRLKKPIFFPHVIRQQLILCLPLSGARLRLCVSRDGAQRLRQLHGLSLQPTGGGI